MHTTGIDINMAYERSWSRGTLKARLDGTWLHVGTPEAIVRNKKSFTGRWLSRILSEDGYSDAESRA